MAFVGALAVALLLSNQNAPLSNGSAAITSVNEYADVENQVQKLTLQPLQAYDTGQKLSPQEMKGLHEASTMVDRMNAFEPLASNYFFLSGKLHHIFGEDQVAEERFRQCALLYQNDAVSRPRDQTQIIETGAEANYQLALLLMARGDVKGSYAAADVAAKAFPNSPNYLVARASALNELRRPADAKRDLAEALKLDPKNARALSLLRFLSHS